MPVLARTAVGIAAVFALFAGCSAPAAAPSSAPAATAASDQSVKDACTALNSTMSEAASTLQTALSDLGSDPEKGLKALQSFTASLQKAGAAVQNPSVKAKVDEAIAALGAMSDALAKGIEDPAKLAEATGTFTRVQEALTGVGTVCPS